VGEFDGMGRSDLERELRRLREERDADRAAKDKAEHREREMRETLRHAQALGTRQLEELRTYRAKAFPSWLADLVAEMATTRAEKYSVDVTQLLEAIGGVTRDVYGGTGDGSQAARRLAALAVRAMIGEHEDPNGRR